MTNHHPNLERKGRYWHYKLQIGGRRIQGSTNAKDLPTARRVLEDKRRELFPAEPTATNQVTPASISLAALVREWLVCHKVTHSEKHCSSLECISRVWLVPWFGNRPLQDLTTAEVLSLRAAILSRGKSATTANNVLRYLKLLLRYAVNVGHLVAMPVRISFLKAQQRLKPVLPKDRIHEYLAVIDSLTEDLQQRCAVRIILGMALREGELLNMKLSWVDSRRKHYAIGRTKGREVRVIPIPAWVWASMESLPKMIGDWVLPDLRTGQPHRSNYLRRLLERAGQEIGIPGLSQHRLRASWACWQAELNTPVHQIAAMMGHKSASVTLGWYVVSNLRSHEQAQATLSESLGFGKGA
jgi:integrase